MTETSKENSEGTLSFRPITEGLGFHPFSDGLPYAPVSKVIPQRPQRPLREPPLGMDMGTGATTAGAPSFARELPRISAPRTAPLPQTAPAGLKPSAPVATRAAAAAATSTTQEAVPQAIVDSVTYGAGYAVLRMLAYLFDTSVNFALLGAALSWVLMRQNLRPDLLLSPSLLIAVVLFVGFFSWALVTAQEIAFGSSLGKRLFGLTVPGGTGSILLRALFFLASLGFCGLGLLWAAFDGKKRCWHDLVTGTQPEWLRRES